MSADPKPSAEAMKAARCNTTLCTGCDMAGRMCDDCLDYGTDKGDV